MLARSLHESTGHFEAEGFSNDAGEYRVRGSFVRSTLAPNRPHGTLPGSHPDSGVKVNIRAKTTRILGAGALAFALGACNANSGSNGATTSGPTVAGTVAGAALTTVTLKDSSVPPQQKTVQSDSSGHYSFDVSGLTPPFMLKAADGSGAAEYGVASQPGPTDIDPVTTTAVALASQAAGSTAAAWSADDTMAMSNNFSAAMDDLQDTLAVLFQHYSVTLTESHATSQGFQTMLSQLEFLVDGALFMVRNRANGSAVFLSRMDDLSSGQFHAENLPGGVTFERDIDPIFTRKFKTVEDPGTCFSCHSQGLPTSDDVPFVWTSPADPVADYKTIVATGLVNTSDPTASLLYLKPTGQIDHGGDQVFRPTSPEAQVILTWIRSGALAASVPGLVPSPIVSPPPSGGTAVSSDNVVASCTACHGLTSNTTVFKAGGYTKTGLTSDQWLAIISDMISMGAQLAPGTSAQGYADYLAGVP